MFTTPSWSLDAAVTLSHSYLFCSSSFQQTCCIITNTMYLSMVLTQHLPGALLPPSPHKHAIQSSSRQDIFLYVFTSYIITSHSHCYYCMIYTETNRIDHHIFSLLVCVTRQIQLADFTENSVRACSQDKQNVHSTAYLAIRITR